VFLELTHGGVALGIEVVTVRAFVCIKAAATDSSCCKCEFDFSGWKCDGRSS
jgi:hypothetical protein